MKYILKDNMTYNNRNKCPVLINFSNINHEHEFSQTTNDRHKLLVDKFKVVTRNYSYHIIYFSLNDEINIFGNYTPEPYYNILMG